MKKLVLFICFLVSVVSAFSINVFNAYADQNDDYVVLGGIPAGFTMSTDGVYVVGLCDVITLDGVKSPAKEIDVEVGDVIKSIDGNIIKNADDIEYNIKNKRNVEIELNRNNEKIIKKLSIAKDLSGHEKIGVFVKDSVSGIGTITFIKDNKFASLGHAVIDDKKGILNIDGGNLFSCKITNVIKGEKGSAGELKGVFLRSNPIATIKKNTETGVYGEITKQFDLDCSKKVQVGHAKVGDATIFSTVNGKEPKEYDISIVKYDCFGENKNFVIKITDKELLEITGGIVQGMSGSPIVQDGKLVGAVTHVFINDPTRGFGISIDNMIDKIE